MNQSLAGWRGDATDGSGGGILPFFDGRKQQKREQARSHVTGGEEEWEDEWLVGGKADRGKLQGGKVSRWYGRENESRRLGGWAGGWVGG